MENKQDQIILTFKHSNFGRGQISRCQKYPSANMTCLSYVMVYRFVIYIYMYYNSYTQMLLDV